MAYTGMPTEHSRGLHCHDIYVYVNRALKGLTDYVNYRPRVTGSAWGVHHSWLSPKIALWLAKLFLGCSLAKFSMLHQKILVSFYFHTPGSLTFLTPYAPCSLAFSNPFSRLPKKPHTKPELQPCQCGIWDYIQFSIWDGG